jgi:hypothetical protein
VRQERVSDDGPIRKLSTRTGAVVRKPPGKEPAGSGRQWCRGLYGYFDAAVEDAGADNVAGGAIVELRGDGNEAWVARKQEREAYLGFAGQRLGRALSRPALGQRYRSVQQRRKRLGRLMRCRS